MPSVEEYPREAADPIKKKSSMRSIFSIFRSSKSAPAVPQQRGYPEKDNIQTTLSFDSLPQTQTDKPSSPYGNPDRLSTMSLPAASSLPSSSSSSASSLEFTSDASTAATTPSTSSPSVVMKGLDSALGASTSSLGAGASTTSLGECAAAAAAPPRRPQPAKKPSWTVPENYRKHPSPLSNMQSAGPPLSLYPLPSPPASPILHDRRNSFMPKRRNSLGRLLSRGYQSSPDLSGMSEDSDEGAMPPMPTKPYSKPSSAGVPSRARTLRRRATEKGRADIEKPTSYTEQEKMEHESILGADPAGYGFYLYPKTSTLSPQRNSYVGGSGSSDSGSPVDGGSGRPSHGRRTWKEAKGRSFRRTVTSQIIMEEECGDSSETAPIAQPQRRHSMAPGIDSQWRAPRQDAGSVGQPTLNGGNNNAARRRSLHNSWDQLSSQIQRHDGPFPALELPQRRRSDQLHDGEEAALRRLQLEANRFMIRTEDVDDTDADDDFGVRPVADRGSGGGSSRNSNVPVPALRVEMVNV